MHCSGLLALQLYDALQSNEKLLVQFELDDERILEGEQGRAQPGQTHLNLNKKPEQHFANLIVPGRLEPFFLDPTGDRFVALE